LIDLRIVHDFHHRFFRRFLRATGRIRQFPMVEASWGSASQRQSSATVHCNRAIRKAFRCSRGPVGSSPRRPNPAQADRARFRHVLEKCASSLVELHRKLLMRKPYQPAGKVINGVVGRRQRTVPTFVEHMQLEIGVELFTGLNRGQQGLAVLELKIAAIRVVSAKIKSRSACSPLASDG
jgi:hypothetical protein